MSEPKTVEELLSCPVRPNNYKTITLNTEEKLSDYPNNKLGDTVHIRIAEKVAVSPVSRDSIYWAEDSDGNLWQPVLLDGIWYRQQVIL